MRFTFPALAVLALGACQPTIPDSGAGVGFGDYGSYMRESEARQLAREAETTVRSARPGQTTSAQAGASDGSTRETAAVGEPLRAPMTVRTEQTDTAAQGSATTPAPLSEATVARPGGALSDEQDFEAVAARETIESDRERLDRQRAEYREVRVTSVPEAGTADGPNIVAYALSTTHEVGEERYRRLNPFRWRNWESNCARFRAQDLAQEHFLARGGPERDPDNLDPDGDGFACWWDPTPFRQAARAGQ